MTWSTCLAMTISAISLLWLILFGYHVADFAECIRARWRLRAIQEGAAGDILLMVVLAGTAALILLAGVICPILWLAAAE